MKVVTIDGVRVCGSEIKKDVYCARVPDHGGDHSLTEFPKLKRGYKVRCYKCGETKPASQFHRNRKAPDGLDRPCKACRATKNVEAYADRGPGECCAPDCNWQRAQRGSGKYFPYCVRHEDLANSHYQNITLKVRKRDKVLAELAEEESS